MTKVGIRGRLLSAILVVHNSSRPLESTLDATLCMMARKRIFAIFSLSSVGSRQRLAVLDALRSFARFARSPERRFSARGQGEPATLSGLSESFAHNDIDGREVGGFKKSLCTDVECPGVQSGFANSQCSRLLLRCLKQCSAYARAPRFCLNRNMMDVEPLVGVHEGRGWPLL